MNHRILLSFALMLAATAALAAPPAPNLSVNITAPGAAPNVYAFAGYTVNVANIGNRDADGVKVTIQLPKTATSPQVYTMGTLGTFDGRCVLGGAAGTAAGTKLVCTLGTVRKNHSTDVAVSLRFPEKTGALVIDATATTTTSPESDPINNSDSQVVSLAYYTHTINTAATYTNQHCTGTSLTAFFECTLFPGSITSHSSQFSGGPAGGTITLPGQPGYDGAWALAGQTLTFSYREISTNMIVAEFSGRGVPTTGCYEGLTRFPDGSGGYSTYVAPYRVCP